MRREEDAEAVRKVFDVRNLLKLPKNVKSLWKEMCSVLLSAERVGYYNAGKICDFTKSSNKIYDNINTNVR